MKLANEFRQNAEEWRSFEKLAATEDHRRRIAAVAKAWRSLAEERELIIRYAGRRMADKRVKQ
jgi:hypothetical protein